MIKLRPTSYSKTYRKGNIVTGESNLGYRPEYTCAECGHQFGEYQMGYTMTSRQTLEDPEDGECYCPSCGRDNFGLSSELPIVLTGRRRFVSGICKDRNH